MKLARSGSARMLRTRDARRWRPLGGFIGLVAAATVAAAVAAPSALANANPVCPNVTVSVASGGSIQLSPSCTDSDGPSALTYQVVSGPSPGSLSPTAIYTPTIGFTGDDSLTDRAFDGADYSNTATVTFHVGTSPPPPPPGQVTGQTVNATATPDTQSSSSFGGTSLELGWDTTYTGGFNPTISQAQIHFDNDFAFDATGLAQCDQTLITPLDTAQALAACPGAEVGSGSLTVTGSSTTLTGVITAFNGVPSGGDPVILLHVSVSSGAVIVVLAATLQPSSLGGDFGTEMAWSLPCARCGPSWTSPSPVPAWLPPTSTSPSTTGGPGITLSLPAATTAIRLGTSPVTSASTTAARSPPRAQSRVTPGRPTPMAMASPTRSMLTLAPLRTRSTTARAPRGRSPTALVCR